MTTLRDLALPIPHPKSCTWASGACVDSVSDHQPPTEQTQETQRHDAQAKDSILDKLAEYDKAIADAHGNMAAVNQANRDARAAYQAALLAHQGEVVRGAHEGIDAERESALAHALFMAEAEARFARPGAPREQVAKRRIDDATAKRDAFIAKHLAELFREIAPDAEAAYGKLEEARARIEPLHAEVAKFGNFAQDLINSARRRASGHYNNEVWKVLENGLPHPSLWAEPAEAVEPEPEPEEVTLAI